MSNAIRDRRTDLEHRAREVRSQLERRLDVIEARRQHWVQVARAVTHSRTSLIVALAVGGTVAAFIVQRVRSRRRRDSGWGTLLHAQAQQESHGLIAMGVESAAKSLITLTLRRVGAALFASPGTPGSVQKESLLADQPNEARIVTDHPSPIL